MHYHGTGPKKVYCDLDVAFPVVNMTLMRSYKNLGLCDGVDLSPTNPRRSDGHSIAPRQKVDFKFGSLARSTRSYKPD